ncbi:MAG: 50S ribosomal protein L28 [bacterium]|nr:50S ribosomal protein L28 [bacterium]
MARRCGITGKGVMAGNNVSHAKNRTRRRFLPNLQNVSFLSTALGRSILLRISARAIRTIEHNGGLDSFLSSAPRASLSADMAKLKKTIEKRSAALAAA